jgi:hypothetical protein
MLGRKSSIGKPVGFDDKLVLSLRSSCRIVEKPTGNEVGLQI